MASSTSAPDFNLVLSGICQAFSLVARDLSVIVSSAKGGTTGAEFPEGIPAHTRLKLCGALQGLEDALAALPLVRENTLPWVFRIEYRHKKNNPVDFHVYLGQMEVTRPAAPRLPMAAEMLNGLRDRLERIARDCLEEAGTTAEYFIRASSRHDHILPARSAREAAWLYSALYLRNRREVREWEAVLNDITQVSRIHTKLDWKDARASA